MLLPVSCLVNCKEKKLGPKVDPYLRIEIKRLAERNELDKPLLVLLKVNEDLTETHKVILKKHNVSIKANIAHIYTAFIPAKSIYDVVRFRFIDYIEAPKDLRTNQLSDSTSSKN